MFVDGTIREYIILRDQLVQQATIACPGKPTIFVLDANREALIVRDGQLLGKVTMLLKEGGKWTGRPLIDHQMSIQSMCLISANTLSLYDGKSNALRIYDLA